MSLIGKWTIVCIIIELALNSYRRNSLDDDDDDSHVNVCFYGHSFARMQWMGGWIFSLRILADQFNADRR